MSNLVVERKPLDEIRQLHSEIESAARITLQKAIRVGQLLADLKERKPHGRWLEFVATELPFTDRTARRYMAVWQNRAKLSGKSDGVSDLSTAYRLLSDVEEIKSTPPAEQPKNIVNLADVKIVGRFSSEAEYAEAQRRAAWGAIAEHYLEAIRMGWMTKEQAIADCRTNFEAMIHRLFQEYDERHSMISI